MGSGVGCYDGGRWLVDAHSLRHWNGGKTENIFGNVNAVLVRRIIVNQSHDDCEATS